jgi:hypothetical protein
MESTFLGILVFVFVAIGVMAAYVLFRLFSGQQ